MWYESQVSAFRSARVGASDALEKQGPAPSSPPAATSSQPAEDLQLMALAAAADPTAQRIIATRLMERVQRLSRSLLQNNADASDASQASLLEILKSAGTFRGESSLERWADRIVVRTALRSAAKRRAEGTTMWDDVDMAVHGSSDPSVIVREYLDRLSEPARTVLVLRHGFEYSIEEIADLTGVSPNTVKDRLLRAREAIRRLVRREQLLDAASASGRGGVR
ncbi:MAG: RNA polymerase sigma factor [Polyangiaceae bacterium]